MTIYKSSVAIRSILGKYGTGTLTNFTYIVRHFAATVDAKEILHFNEYSDDWWNEFGTFKPLHSMNKLRIPLVRDGVLSNASGAPAQIRSPKPLKGFSILDVGCAGGILSEPLARIGAEVTGLDPSSQVIEKLQSRIKPDLKNLSYVNSTIEEHAESYAETYDAVVASEVVEHVTNKRQFIKSCIQCLKPGGNLFFTTVNKSLITKFLFITMAEDIADVVPKGTHEYEKFISPHDLRQMLEEENCRTVLLHGMVYNFLTNSWTWRARSDLSYCIHAVKLN